MSLGAVPKDSPWSSSYIKEGERKLGFSSLKIRFQRQHFFFKYLLFDLFKIFDYRTNSQSLFIRKNRSQAWLLSKFYFGESDLTASEFLESNDGTVLSSRLLEAQGVTDTDRSEIRKFISNFQNWSLHAASYIKANTIEVSSLGR